ncbi:MAG: DUF4129 domain-containing protein [Planctomycetota bacterium]
MPALVAGHAQASAPTYDEARASLERALEGAQFDSEEPNFFDRALDAVLEFLGEALESLFTFLGVAEDAAQGLATIVGWALILLLVGGLLSLLWRNLRRIAPARSSATPAGLQPTDPSRSLGAALLADAEALASRSEWSAALATLYEAVIHCLDERRAVRYVPRKTANAYARELSGAARSAWSRLVSECQLVAYGERPADESRWRTARAAAQELEVYR